MTPTPVLVTGGSGFIGTHAVRALLATGRRVRILDLRPSVLHHANLEMIVGDVRDPETVASAVRGSEAILHFAALASVEVCQRDPEDSRRTNVGGTRNVLDAVSRCGHSPRVLFAGSASAYGSLGRPGVPIQEATPLPPPLSSYAAQKIESEELLREAARARGLAAIVFRFFNVYGAGQDPHSPYSGVISVFRERIREGKELRLYGGGFQTRDYVSVSDIVRACLLGLELPAKACDGEPINLGSGTATSVRELAELLVQASGKRVPLVDAPPREGDVPHSRADISRARERLGWTPRMNLQEGLKALLTTT